MSDHPDNLTLILLKRIDEKLDRLLECFPLPMRRVTEERKTVPEKQPDRLSELIDEFEKLSPEERKRDIGRANEFLRIHGVDALREPMTPDADKKSQCPN